MPVKSVFIDEDTEGQEDIEMVLSCTAEGGRPLPALSWSLPEHIEYQTKEESETLVIILMLDHKTFCLILGRWNFCFDQ